MLESQELDLSEGSSLESRWDTPSRHPSCQAMGLEEWLVPQARLGIQRGQGLAPRLQQQRLKQQRSLVLEEPEFSLALVLVVLAFLAHPAQFLASEALQGPGLQTLLLLLPPPLKQPNTALLESLAQE